MDNNRVASGPLTAPYASYSLLVNRNNSGTLITDMVVNSSGYVGIGTSTPSTPLEVVGNATFENNLNVAQDALISGNSLLNGTLYTRGVATFASTVLVSGNVGIGVTSPAYPLDVNGDAHISNILYSTGVNTTGNVNVGQSLSVGASATVAGNATVSGYVQIGNVATPNIYPTTNGYMLYVQGGVLAESFKVAPSTSPDWFDMVFDSSYALRPLADVEQYVRKNRHLPDIPSADDVAKNGIDVAKMDGRLLQKIEELTLYVIQLKSELEKLKTAKK